MKCRNGHTETKSNSSKLVIVMKKASKKEDSRRHFDRLTYRQIQTDHGTSAAIGQTDRQTDRQTTDLLIQAMLQQSHHTLLNDY